ncbi:hypothetical protein Pla123a_01280 [Posidoniimonas polymericola]|uniref:PH domain-containing protein n=1 Tax=Posidoniimonas polymericola TaxID=2528002 RepID=A0A5C5ZEP7_9BACT|nr:hypothetical protein [Posidoniimonas polymericola]TWT85321.1 hypothetical protein Pla123a_01280 [Posidoniimonas polymericola]
MHQISAKSTPLYKRVFPTVGTALVGVVMLIGVGAGIATRQTFVVAVFVGIPLFMAVFGVMVLKQTVLRLVDEVWDCGDTILIRNNGREHRFPLAAFSGIVCTKFRNPPQATLTLREPDDDLGGEIRFLPPGRPSPLSTPPAIEDLRSRIDATNAHGDLRNP